MTFIKLGLQLVVYFEQVNDEHHIFNPDFLVKHGDTIYVLETKPDEISAGKENNDSAAKIRAKVKDSDSIGFDIEQLGISKV